MHGITEIRKMNRTATDLPQTKRETDFRVQRDRLGQVLRKMLAGDAAAETDARKALLEIFGK